jgi:hypothetical protein
MIVPHSTVSVTTIESINRSTLAYGEAQASEKTHSVLQLRDPICYNTVYNRKIGCREPSQQGETSFLSF